MLDRGSRLIVSSTVRDLGGAVLAGAMLASMLALMLPAGGACAEIASDWHQAYNSRVRLVAASEAGKAYAAIEIEMAPGWKTYWRNPGDGGGVPPAFSWKESGNLLSSVVLYPAPKRIKDAAGDTIGYSGQVVFPVRFAPADPARPVKLALDLEFGICKDICVPVEARLELEVPPRLDGQMPAELTSALERVPRVAEAARSKDPRVVRREARLDGDKPRLLLEVDYPGGVEGADAFIEGPDGVFVPQPQLDASTSRAGLRRTFIVDLSAGVDVSELRGMRLTVTLTSDAGQSQAHWPLD